MRTRRCINARTPETGANHLGGSFDSFDAKADGRQATGRGESTKTHLMGRGFLCADYSNQPLAQCKGRSDSFTEISSDAPTTRRFGPPTPEEKARRLAVLRAVLADSAPEFQARIDAGERGEQP